jgi:hypothetical protein
LSPWQTLEIDESADKRAIKRAYARLIKVHRPDDDANKFQQIRDAYENCLAQLEYQAAYESNEETFEPASDRSMVEFEHISSVEVNQNHEIQIEKEISPEALALEQETQKNELVLNDFYQCFDHVIETLQSLKNINDWHPDLWQSIMNHPALDVFTLKSYLRTQVFERLEMTFERNYVRISYPYNLPEDFITDVADLFHFKDLEGQSDTPFMMILNEHYYPNYAQIHAQQNYDEEVEAQNTPPLKFAFNVFITLATVVLILYLLFSEQHSFNYFYFIPCFAILLKNSRYFWQYFRTN